jgi:acyl-CoA thioester hydrolase
MQTYRGVVYPAQSDAMGHMTVQYYVAAFDQAMWHLVESLGYDPAWRTDRHEGWADVRYEIDFRAELRVGDLFKVESRVTGVGNSSLKTHHVLSGPQGAVAAEVHMTSVYFDLEARRSKPIPETVKTAAKERVYELAVDGLQAP